MSDRVSLAGPAGETVDLQPLLSTPQLRLSGLGDIAPSERPFYPIEAFDPLAERYQGTTLLAVDRS